MLRNAQHFPAPEPDPTPRPAPPWHAPRKRDRIQGVSIHPRARAALGGLCAGASSGTNFAGTALAFSRSGWQSRVCGCKVRARRGASKHPPKRRSSCGMSRNTLNTVPFAWRVLGGAGRGVGRAPRNRVAPNGLAPRELRENASAVPAKFESEEAPVNTPQSAARALGCIETPSIRSRLRGACQGGRVAAWGQAQVRGSVEHFAAAVKRNSVFQAMPRRGRATMPSATLPRSFKADSRSTTTIHNS